MKLDTPITNPAGPGRGADANYLNEQRLLSTEEERHLERAVEQLDNARIAKVLAMTAQRFGKLSPVERRNYTRWAKAFAKVFAEKASMFERNSTPEPELPVTLRAEGVL